MEMRQGTVTLRSSSPGKKTMGTKIADDDDYLIASGSTQGKKRAKQDQGNRDTKKKTVAPIVTIDLT